MFIVETYTLSDGWINTWTEDDQPLIFKTHADAWDALQEHLEDYREAVKQGHITSAPSPSEYRVRQIED